MKKALILSVTLLLLSAPSIASNQDRNENRIAKLEQQIMLLSKQVQWLQKQIEQEREYQSNNNHMYQCQLAAFGNEYIGRSSSRGRAVTKAVEDCNEAQSAMFCRPENVKCVKY
ncbi:hypothetical protein [uncultured Photobacterium sp.]|uniref:hypothetical protein n=1 Tax=uncultured Photobacterium sp. TaxID=173973 RepID=UPI0026286C95|nr:hypothetical protein [uncultured Photobacterium sp.]